MIEDKGIIWYEQSENGYIWNSILILFFKFFIIAILLYLIAFVDTLNEIVFIFFCFNLIVFLSFLLFILNLHNFLLFFKFVLFLV